MLKSSSETDALNEAFNDQGGKFQAPSGNPAIPVTLYYKDENYPTFHADIKLRAAGKYPKYEAFTALHAEIINSRLKFMWTHVGFGDGAPLISKEDLIKEMSDKKIIAIYEAIQSPDLEKQKRLKRLHAQSGFGRF